ncbi:hypothetical protein NP233_g7692 [Leucocoprinus birnbaumii]|uniref:G domain-containing protein n=1 Tax=Leucocoprinus birnbaumii TaxID=56174 RepID=A0AAD5VU82_9AGAR|nr:hypothetical protein NP233_g7692 [Leucocoprinus birnbaumii]
MRPASMFLPKALYSVKHDSQDEVIHANGTSPSPASSNIRAMFMNTFGKSSSRERSDSAPAQLQNVHKDLPDTPYVPNQKFVIALLGPSGAGKSSFIAHATGQNVEIGHLLTACTSSIDTFEKPLPDGRTVVFVDTPGYDLADKNPNRVLNMLTQWLKTQSTDGAKVTLNAILFFHRINDNRMPVATRSHINRFEKLVGKKGAQKRVLLITTMWDEVDSIVGAFREEQLKNDFWKKFIDGGSSVCRFRRGHGSAWEILNPLIGGQGEDGPLPSVFESVFYEEPEEEAELDADQALGVMEQIYLDQQRLLERLQVALGEQSPRQNDMLRDFLDEEKKVSSKLGTLLTRLKRQNLRR